MLVRFIGMDSRAIAEGEIAIGISSSPGEPYSRRRLGSGCIEGPQDPLYEVEPPPRVPSDVEFEAWDAEEPFCSALLTKVPPCRASLTREQLAKEPPDLVVDLTPFLHLRELRVLDSSFRPIDAPPAAFRPSGEQHKAFAFEDGRVLLVFSATGTAVHGVLEAAGFRDRELEFRTDAGWFTEHVELQPGFEVEFRADGIRILDSDRLAGLCVERAPEDTGDSKALTTAGSDVRGEITTWSFFFDSGGTVRLRLPRAGEFAAHPILGQRVGPGIKILEVSKRPQVFVVALSEGALQTVELDAKAWEGLGE
jgi:hypothetical protein